MPTAAINGIDLNYRLAGPEGAPVIAFSNSLGGTLETWGGVVPLLADRYRCLTYDTRGHGLSGSADRATTIDDLADDLAGLLDAIGAPTAHVVGLSLGGMTGQALASARPDRVDRLVLVATAPYLSPAENWTARAATVRKEGMAAVVDAIVGRWFTAPFYARAANVVEGVRDRFLASDPAGYARCCEAIAAMDLRDRLAAIHAPTLVVAGADDPVTPPETMAGLSRAVAGADFMVLAGASHMLAVERPEALAAHVAGFLGGDGPASAFARGLAVRKSVLGDDYVAGAIAKAGAFGAPWQDFITRVAWGEIWGDATLPKKTRSMLTLAMTIALGREDEFKIHVRGALGNGVTKEELRALLMQSAIYAGVPAANSAFHWLSDVLGEELD